MIWQAPRRSRAASKASRIRRRSPTPCISSPPPSCARPSRELDHTRPYFEALRGRDQANLPHRQTTWTAAISTRTDTTSRSREPTAAWSSPRTRAWRALTTRMCCKEAEKLLAEHPDTKLYRGRANTDGTIFTQHAYSRRAQLSLYRPEPHHAPGAGRSAAILLERVMSAES